LLDMCEKKYGGANVDKHHIWGTCSFLEGYLNDFAYDRLLIRNLKYFVDHTSGDTGENSIDVECIRTIGRRLSKKGPHVEDVEAIINHYKKQSFSIDKKPSYIVNIFVSYLHDHHKRKYYKTFSEEASKRIHEANEFYQKGKMKYVKKEYPDASDLFFKTLIILTQYGFKSNPFLGTAYFNYGRSLQQQGKPSDAIIFLKNSLRLRQLYHKPKEGKSKLKHKREKEDPITKTARVIRECESSIEDLVPSHRPGSQYCR